MPSYRAAVLTCAVLLATILPAAADEQEDSTLRCLAVMAKINQNQNQRQQLESLIGGYFYLGRLPTTYAITNIGLDVARSFSKMSAAEFFAETARCEKEMQAQGKLMVTIGAAMPKSATLPEGSEQLKKPN
jgi:hypothetical protein